MSYSLQSDGKEKRNELSSVLILSPLYYRYDINPFGDDGTWTGT